MHVALFKGIYIKVLSRVTTKITHKERNSTLLWWRTRCMRG